MSNKEKLNRRNWLQLGFGAAIGSISLPLSSCNAEENIVEESCTTTSQATMGPFHPNEEQSDTDLDLTRIQGSEKLAEGEIIYIKGKVTDENCQAVPGAVVMIWQANSHGKYNHEYDQSRNQEDPDFQGWGQVLTSINGEFSFKTIKPNGYSVAEGSDIFRTPHIHFKVSKRGFHELITQMYFDGEATNATDVFASQLSQEEKDQVIRKPVKEEGKDHPVYPFNLVLSKVDLRALRRQQLQSYIGQYELDLSSPEMQEELDVFYGGPRDQLVLSISMDNEILCATMPIQPKCEIFKKDSDTFEYLAFETDIEFLRDPNGVVNGCTLHRHYDFPPIHGKKTS